MHVEDNWYAENNPDAEGARLAGDIKSLREHFLMSGYFEGRLPAELPFDPLWYRKHYLDITQSFPASDPGNMRPEHFLSKG